MFASPQSILIIDDNPQSGNFIRSIFVRAGYAAHVSATAREAIDYLMGDPDAVAVMVMDLQTIALDTPLRSVLNSRRPDMRFIFLTDSPTPGEVANLGGPYDWPVFPKSFAPGELLIVLKTVLETDIPVSPIPAFDRDTPEQSAAVDALLGV